MSIGQYAAIGFTLGLMLGSIWGTGYLIIRKLGEILDTLKSK